MTINNNPGMCIYALEPHSAYEEFEDGGLVFNQTDLTITSINLTGCQVLKLTNGQRSIQEIAHFITRLFDISIEVAISDIIDFYTQMQAYNHVRLLQNADQKAEYALSDFSGLKKCYTSKPEVATRIIDDGANITHLQQGIRKQLNASGLLIWRLCDGRHTLCDIAEALNDYYEEISINQCLVDAQAFLDDLELAGFVKVIQSGTSVKS